MSGVVRLSERSYRFKYLRTSCEKLSNHEIGTRFMIWQTSGGRQASTRNGMPPVMSAVCGKTAAARPDTF